jgi:hypothetical protein
MALWRGREEIGVEPQSADEGCAAVEGVGQVVDREAAVANEDDVATGPARGQPAAELERPLAGPVGRQLVPAATLEVGAL